MCAQSAVNVAVELVAYRRDEYVTLRRGAWVDASAFDVSCLPVDEGFEHKIGLIERQTELVQVILRSDYDLYPVRTGCLHICFYRVVRPAAAPKYVRIAVASVAKV